MIMLSELYILDDVTCKNESVRLSQAFTSADR